MKKWVILLLCVFLTNILAVTVFSQCVDYCSPVSGDADSGSTLTFYQNSVYPKNLGPYRYKSEAYKDVLFIANEVCDANGCSCTHNPQKCDEWERCENAGCVCVEEYCDGWCLYQSKEQKEVPVFDGSEFSGCAQPQGSCNGDMYEISSSPYGDCVCSWCSIKDFYECDSASVDDSHPCTSNNCAHDFAGNKNYCCPADSCAHVGTNDFTPSGDGTSGESITPELYCYSDGTYAQYQGYLFKCVAGEWNFIGGNNPDFEDNCGKTIYNYVLFSNPEPKYPTEGSWGYHDYAYYPLVIGLKEKDVVAKLTPADENTKIEIDNSEPIIGNEIAVEKSLTDEAYIKFFGNKNPENTKYNLYVDCYTPDTKTCDPTKEECWPDSMCSQDQPANIILDDNKEANPVFNVQFLNGANIECYLSTMDKEGKVETKQIAELGKEITLGEYSLIACKVTSNGAGGFDASLLGYFPFGDDDGVMETKDEKCEDNPEWKYYSTLDNSEPPKIEGKSWKDFDYKSSEWKTGNQPFGGYFGEQDLGNHNVWGLTKNHYRHCSEPGYPDQYYPIKAYRESTGTYDDWCLVDCNSFSSATSRRNCQTQFPRDHLYLKGYLACTSGFEENNDDSVILKDAGDTLYLRKYIEPDYHFYCCPNLSCAHKDSETGEVDCYNQGVHPLSVEGESEQDKECLWKCENSDWGKMGVGEECLRNCDCYLPSDEEKPSCMMTLENMEKNICCPEGYCAKSVGECVSDGTQVEKCFCEKGAWNCLNSKTVVSNKREVLLKDVNQTTDQIETGFAEAKNGKVKVFVFFDKGNYNGNVEIEGSDDCSFIKSSAQVEEKFEFEDTFSGTKNFKCRLKIIANGIGGGEYLFYTGVAAVIQYI